MEPIRFNFSRCGNIHVYSMIEHYQMDQGRNNDEIKKKIDLRH